MPTSMLQYEMLPTTWFYVSTLIILAVFFKFNRVWSVRNLDLVGIILLTPGLIFLAMSDSQIGYIWIFVVEFLLLIRLFFDTVMVRRPLLEPNLTPGGLMFSCFFLVIFIVAALTVNRGDKIDTVRTVRLEQVLTTRHIKETIGMNPVSLTIPAKELPNMPPGCRPFLAFAERTNLMFAPSPKIRSEILTGKVSNAEPNVIPFTNNANQTTNKTTTDTPAVIANLTNEPTPNNPTNDTNEPALPNTATVKTIPQPIMLSEPNTTQPATTTSSPAAAHNPTPITTSTPTSTNPIIEQPTTPTTTTTTTTPTAATTTLTLPPKPNLISDSDDANESVTESFVMQTIPIPGLGLFCSVMVIAISVQLLIVIAFLYIGHCHFGNIRTGVACATLYLLLPYTNQMVGRLDHIVPAALILWGVALYRRPFCTGLCLGSATALVFYPICLVPLWCSFYWRKGWLRFLIGVISAMFVFAILLLFAPASLGSYFDQLIHMFGKSSLKLFSRADGFWSYHNMIYRIPLLACFFAICFGMLLWPLRKHLATLLSCSTILMIGTQFWQLHQGGLYFAWFMPLLILTVFRPNLEDRVAQSTVV
ncbi:MAG: DUF2029 domain-containing protein [Planctomycetaceae bacterium]|jgi:hypothetical protein|nr:DUF2029 domain-containing protein [Planctomycetaceae bacterium]